MENRASGATPTVVHCLLATDEEVRILTVNKDGTAERLIERVTEVTKWHR